MADDELQFDLTLYPSPVLRRPAAPVETFDEELAEVVGAMYRRMHDSQGVGLAAPQVGLKKRILVVSHTGEEADQRVFINPEILERSGASVVLEEGCLSFPGIFAEVERPDVCRIKAFDIEGKAFEETFDGFPSRILQHEHDHLEGILLVDRMSAADKVRHKAALEDLVFEYKQQRDAKPAGKR